MQFHSPQTRIKLTYRENTFSAPSLDKPSSAFIKIVLIHGLDSSSITWDGILDDLKTVTKAVAFDMRGCGESSLGNVNDFTPDNLVEDLLYSLGQHNDFNKDGVIEPFVLVGHSMGGRIAMSFAAKYPNLVKALVVEDMDIRSRCMETNVFCNPDRDRSKTISFDRNLRVSNEDQVKNIFEVEGYPRDLTTKWLKEGRIRIHENKKDTSPKYYSEVNPAFRILCYEQFFNTYHGQEVFTQLAKQKHTYPIYIMVADREMTVCSNESIWKMQNIMKAENRFMAIYRYQGASHSIHNSVREAFIKDILGILSYASCTI